MKNSEVYLRQCINTVIAQSYSDMEIIIVDDRSDDSSWEIAMQYSKVDNRIKVLKALPNVGNPRNTGIIAARETSSYFCFLDSDDFFDEKMIEILVLAAKNSGADIVVCKALRYNNESHKTRIMDYQAAILLPGEKKKVYSTVDIKEQLFQTTVANPWSKLFKRELIAENNLLFQDLHNSNDVSFVFTAMALAKRIAYIDNPLVYYRTHHRSTCQGTKNRYPLDCLAAYSRLKEQLVHFICYEKYYESFAAFVRNGYEWNYASLEDEYAKSIMRHNKDKFEALL